MNLHSTCIVFLRCQTNISPCWLAAICWVLFDMSGHSGLKALFGVGSPQDFVTSI